MSSFPEQQATFRNVFAVREFRAIWASQILSEGGNRLAPVALTLLIYDQTNYSPLLAALAYAAGYVPWVIGGLLFSGLGDRLPRREVMVACDVIGALLVAAMLIPRVPVAGLVALLYLTTMVQAPFETARSAILPDILHGERYALAATVMSQPSAWRLWPERPSGELWSPSSEPGRPLAWMPPRLSCPPCWSASGPGPGRPPSRPISAR